MGWIFSVALFIVYFQNRTGVNADVILIAAAIFAVAGGLGSVSSRIAQLKDK